MGRDGDRSRDRQRRSYSRSRSRSRSRNRHREKDGRRDSERDRSRDRRPQQQQLRRPPRSRSRSKERHGAGRHRSSRRSRSPLHAAAVRGSPQPALRDSSRELQRQHSGRPERSRSRERHRSGRSRSSEQRRRSSRSRSRSREGRRGRGSSRSPPALRRDSRDRERDRDRTDRGPSSRGHSSKEDHRRSSRWEQQQQQDQRLLPASQQQFPPPPQQQFPPPPALHGTSKWDTGGGGRPMRLPAVPLSDEPPAVGSIHRGMVHTVKPFGVFVSIEGHRRHVLVHHTQVSEEVLLTRGDEDELKVKALEYAAPPGQRVWVKVLEVSQDQGGSGFRVHGSMRVVDQDSGQDLDPTGQVAAAAATKGGGGGRLSDEAPEVFSIHRGEVKRLEAYGVFVALQGYRKYGLVHASQVANYLEFSAEDSEADRKKALGEVVEVGQDVWVKVVEVGHDDRGPKIGCSMKLVDQADGTDLDPQNMRYRPRGEGGQGGPGSRAPVGASAGEVRGGTVDWGYLATRPDAFGSAGYDLLQDEPQEQQQPHGGPAAPGGRGGGGGGFPPPPQQQQQLPPVGRGRGAVVPAWMKQQGSAAPGSVLHRDSGGSDAPAANLTVEEALRIVQAAAGKKKHKEKHKKHKKNSKHKKHKKSSRKHSRSRSRGRSSSGSESDRSS